MVYLLIYKQHMTLCGERNNGVKCMNSVSPQTIVKLSRILNNEINAKVKIGKQFYSEFKVNKILR